MNKKNHILVLTYWSYSEGLVQAYTIPYLRIIKKLNPENISITLVTLEKDHESIAKVSGIIDTDFELLPLPYYPFGAKAILHWMKNISLLKKFIRAKKVNTIHCWCTPAGMIGYILHKKTGIRLIADSFEPHAEAMVENGTWKKNSLAFKLLFHFEKKIVKAAEEIICIAPGMESYIKEKYHYQPQKVYVKPACVDLDKFSFTNRKKINLLHSLGLENKIVALYAGKFGGIYLDKEVFDFFKVAYDYWKEKLKILLLTNEEPQKLNALIENSGVPETVFISKFIPHERIQDYMGLADFALCPVKPVPTKKYCSPIKTGEYWALGLPVVITKNISNDSDVISENNAGYVWKQLSDEEFLNSVKYIDELLKNNSIESINIRIRPLAERYRNYTMAEKIYKKIYYNRTY